MRPVGAKRHGVRQSSGALHLSNAFFIFSFFIPHWYMPAGRGTFGDCRFIRHHFDPRVSKNTAGQAKTIVLASNPMKVINDSFVAQSDC